ncbi:MAG: DUF721 domain-containing protein [Elusimicrobiota bacterium]
MDGRKPRMAKAGDILGAWTRRSGLESERMLILNQVWENEVGMFSRQWNLIGIRRGVLCVKVRSPAAAHELQMRGMQLVKSLNKYFKRSWIKGVRTMNG